MGFSSLGVPGGALFTEAQSSKQVEPAKCKVASNKTLQVSRDCVLFIKPLFSQVVATRAAPELNRYAATASDVRFRWALGPRRSLL